MDSQNTFPRLPEVSPCSWSRTLMAHRKSKTTRFNKGVDSRGASLVVFEDEFSALKGHLMHGALTEASWRWCRLKPRHFLDTISKPPPPHPTSSSISWDFQKEKEKQEYLTSSGFLDRMEQLITRIIDTAFALCP